MAKTDNKPLNSANSLTGLLADFRLLIILFVALRLLLLMAYQPLTIQGIERGVSAGGDFAHYFGLGELTNRGLMPFRDWWSEFPPVPSFLITFVFQVTGGQNYTAFAAFFGLLMLLADVGVLVMMRNIGTHLHGSTTGMALAWIYALMLAPLVFIWWNFEILVAFFLLLGLWWLLKKQEMRSAAAAAVGALTKFTPALLLGAVWRFRDVRSALRYTLITLGGFVLVYGLLFIQNSQMTLPSLTAQFNKASYQTVWALFDGNYRTGNFGSPESHLDPDAANILYGNPAMIPGIVRLGLAALIGLFVFWRTRRFDDKGLVAFVTITLLIFFLQAQGWSPQWLAQIIPLALLCFPTRNGIVICVMLTLLTFAEYPVLFIRTGDTGGEITGALITPFVILVLARTILLVGLCIALYRRLRQAPIVL
jgi:hypothetical protein